MYNPFILGVEIVCSSIILFRSIQIGSRLDWKTWNGHPLQFIGNSLAYPLLAGGSIGVILDRSGGFVLLLLGVMLLIVSDRRRAK